MTQSHEHQSSTDTVDFSFDRETLGTILLRHPWAVRFLAFEAVLVSLAGAIPFFGESGLNYVLFGIILSIAALTAALGVVVAILATVKRLRHERKHGHHQNF
jgi:cell division protein FtsX